MPDLEHPRVPPPTRPEQDEATRFMRLSRDDLRADFYWRYAAAVENFWRVRTRQLRPPMSVRIRVALVPFARWCMRARHACGKK